MNYDGFVWHCKQISKIEGIKSGEVSKSENHIAPEKDLTKMSISGLAKLGIGRVSRVKK